MNDSASRPDIYYIIPDSYPSDAWLKEVMDFDKLELLSETIGFDQIVAKATDIVAGKIKGRVIVDLAK